MARTFNGAGDGISAVGTSHPTTATYLLTARRTGDGDSGFLRLFHQDPTLLRLQYQTADTLMFFAELFSTGESSWTWASPALNALSRIAIGYDGSSFSNDPSVWMDGAKQTLTPSRVTSGTFNGAAGSIVLGNRSGFDRSWQGDLAEFARYAYVFSEGNLKAYTLGYSPDFWPDYDDYIPMLRDNISRRTSAPTLTGTSVGPHPPMIYPGSGQTRKWLAPVAGGGPTTAELAGVFAQSRTPAGLGAVYV